MAQKQGSALVTGLFFLILLMLTVTLGHEALEQRLDSGRPLPLVLTGDKGRTYKCLQTSINFRIHGHIMTLIDVGAHSMQEVYKSLHVHDLGQLVTVFVTLHAHQPTKDSSSHFTKPVLTATAILHYSGSKISPSKPLPIGPNCHIHWSIKRGKRIRLNLIANAARPDPQGSSHNGSKPIVRILVLENAAAETKPCTYKKFPAEIEPFPAETKLFPADTKPSIHKKSTAETEPFPAETKPCTYKKFPAETEPFPADIRLFPAETKPCTHKKSTAETEPFPAETKTCSHVVHILPRNRKLLGKLPDVNVHSPPSTPNEKSWNLDKEDPPSPPSPTGNHPHHP